MRGFTLESRPARRPAARRDVCRAPRGEPGLASTSVGPEARTDPSPRRERRPAVASPTDRGAWRHAGGGRREDAGRGSAGDSDAGDSPPPRGRRRMSARALPRPSARRGGPAALLGHLAPRSRSARPRRVVDVDQEDPGPDLDRLLLVARGARLVALPQEECDLLLGRSGGGVPRSSKGLSSPASKGRSEPGAARSDAGASRESESRESESRESEPKLFAGRGRGRERHRDIPGRPRRGRGRGGGRVAVLQQHLGRVPAHGGGRGTSMTARSSSRSTSALGFLAFSWSFRAGPNRGSILRMKSHPIRQSSIFPSRKRSSVWRNVERIFSRTSAGRLQVAGIVCRRGTCRSQCSPPGRGASPDPWRCVSRSLSVKL